MKRAPRQPVGELTLYAGIYCKRWTIPEIGTILPQHAHEHAHLTYVVSGAIRLWRGDRYAGDYYAPSAIKIPARTKHTFQAAADDVVLLCLHNADHAAADGEPPIHAEHQIVMEN